MIYRRRSVAKFLKFNLFLCSAILLLSNSTNAQMGLLKSDTTKLAQDSTRIWPADSLGRRTPRGTVEGFIRAVATRNYPSAALFLNLDSSLKKGQDSTKLVVALQTLLDKDGSIYPYSWISNEPAGLQDDNLGPNQDRIGVASVNGESFDLILESKKGPDGGPLWLFSSQTIQRVPLDTAKVKETTLVEKVSPKILEENEWGGVPIAHWLAMLAIIVVAYLLAVLITRFLVFILPTIWIKARQESTAGIINSFVLPIRLYLAVWLFVVASRHAGISIIVRQRLNDVTVIVGLVAFLLLLWQLLDFLTRLVERRMLHLGNQSGVSALLFLRRAAKVALVVLGVIAILRTFGFDVTTWLTALGIGGIALALGTQKTVENFVGSVTLIADHPIRVGDFCKIGEVTGTVEQIGMRTTRIRTGERTIVSIPNGELSSAKIENFAPRDRFLFAPVLQLRYETTPDQIRYLLVELRKVLYAHPKVNPDPARIRFIGFRASAVNLEIFSYINTTSNDEFLEVQEDLLLRMMDIITTSGTSLAFPTQTIYFAKDNGVSKEKAAEAEGQVTKWREAGELQLPNFTSDVIRDLSGTIHYPPKGSSMGGNPG
jgi:MscS family membrane protein